MPAVSAEPTDLQRQFQATLDAFRTTYDFPGATAAYVLPNGEVGVAATGLADVRTRTAMTPRWRMPAASIGKTFVAATVVALARDGCLALDDQLSDWLGDRDWFKRLPNHDSISLRQLLMHSSGLPDHVHDAAFQKAASERWRGADNPFPPEALVAFVLDQPALFEAGQGWAYTDTGFILLGMVIETVTGQDYYEVIHTRFTGPLHLDETTASNRPDLQNLATGYMRDDNRFGLPSETTTSLGVMAWNPGVEWTGGGLLSTSRDLALWGAALFRGRAMDGPYLAELLAAVPIDPHDPDTEYGLGVAVHHGGPYGTVYGHGGWIPGYSSSLRYYAPDQYRYRHCRRFYAACARAGAPACGGIVEQKFTGRGRWPVTLTDLSVLVLQIALPVGLLAWLALAPARNTLSYLAQIATVAFYLLAVCLVPIWLVPPWWTPRVYVAVAIAIAASQLLGGKISSRPRLPRTRPAWAATVVLVFCAAVVAAVSFRAIAGRAAPDVLVDLAFPLGPGAYLVASGGSTAIVNGHFMTLEPKTDRQRAYRGQSYAVDLIKLGDAGLRAPGWRPRDPAVYEIFGEPVLAPCSGRVLSALDGKPDMRVPEMDTSLLEGNHVFIDCGRFGVLLAHLRQGSLGVVVGDPVTTGERLGEAGNSGRSGEPHLHIHAQRIPAEGPLLSGDPLFITLNDRFLVRNDRVTIAKER